MAGTPPVRVVFSTQMDEQNSARQIVLAWHEALNAGAIDRLVQLSCEDIEFGGPRGSGRGAQILKEWVGRSGVRLDPTRIIDRGETVVVEQVATWPADEQAHRVASLFRVRGSKISSVIRYPDLPTALTAAGLDAPDTAAASD